mmetsp:Transcript_9869/g.30221  ORF Transcript_9869/g.30221 Transcript_9869/m.30221 type:complete len:214 (-) Transcript_9869:5-646(-)
MCDHRHGRGKLFLHLAERRHPVTEGAAIELTIVDGSRRMRGSGRLLFDWWGGRASLGVLQVLVLHQIPRRTHGKGVFPLFGCLLLSSTLELRLQPCEFCGVQRGCGGCSGLCSLSRRAQLVLRPHQSLTAATLLLGITERGGKRPSEAGGSRAQLRPEQLERVLGVEDSCVEKELREHHRPQRVVGIRSSRKGTGRRERGEEGGVCVCVCVCV